MRKVIVFKVENVLVNGFDERRNDELNAKRVVRELVGDEFFESEFVGKERKNGKVVRKVVGFGEMMKKLEEWERRFKEEGNIERLYWMRGVRKKLEVWEWNKNERMDVMRRRYSEESFGKRVIGIRDDLRLLERICERTGGKMVFVSGERRNNVEKLLWANGLREYEVESDLGFLEGMEEKDYVVFDSVESLDGMWGKIGLRRG